MGSPCSLSVAESPGLWREAQAAGNPVLSCPFLRRDWSEVPPLSAWLVSAGPMRAPAGRGT